MIALAWVIIGSVVLIVGILILTNVLAEWIYNREQRQYESRKNNEH